VPQAQGIVSKWRQKERLKTTAVSLVLCLNIGVDPPDVMKISPCARLECWVDPLSMQPPKALDTIGAQPARCHVAHDHDHKMAAPRPSWQASMGLQESVRKVLS